AAPEAVRRRHQHARARAVSVAAARPPAHPHACGVESVSRGAVGRRVPHAVQRPGGDPDPPRRVRLSARVARARGRRPGARTPRPGAGGGSRARLVTAADGANSVRARRLGLTPGGPRAKRPLDMMEEPPAVALRAAEPETLSVFYGYGGAHGYAYIFPKRAHVNVGIGYVLPYFTEQVDVAPYDLQRAFVGDLRARGLVAGESRREHFTPFLIPIGGPLKTTAQGRVLLAGDAGGFVNGFSAPGLSY